MESPSTWTSFSGNSLISSGDLRTMLRETKRHLEAGGEPVLIFEDQSGRQVDFNFRGTVEQVLERGGPSPGGPGRPRLGVVPREVTLLPRHWDWLERQPSGASAAIRKLVEEARKRDPLKERARLAAEATNRFLTAMAGNLPGYEAALRALFAGDRKRFEREMKSWPADVRKHAAAISGDAFAGLG